MIRGADIAKALGRRWPRLEPFDAGRRARRELRTLGDLLAMAPAEGRPEVDRIRPDFRVLPPAAGPGRSPLPAGDEGLTAMAPAATEHEYEDYALFCSLGCRWLRSRRQRVDLRWPVADRDGGMIACGESRFFQALDKEFIGAAGCSFGEIFGDLALWDDPREMSCDGTAPVWILEMEEEAAGLIDLLDRICYSARQTRRRRFGVFGGLPEAMVEAVWRVQVLVRTDGGTDEVSAGQRLAWGETEITRTLDHVVRSMDRRCWRDVLGEAWDEALEFLRGYRGCVCVWSCEEARWRLDCWKEWRLMTKAVREMKAMQNATYRVIRACGERGDEFWIDLARRLDAYATKHPEATTAPR